MEASLQFESFFKKYKKLIADSSRILIQKKAYKEISIEKKNGGTRVLHIPQKPLDILQKYIYKELQKIYTEPPSCVHSFIKKRSIVTNAKKHCKKKIVLNIDLLDFFGYINFGRVRGLFMAKPYQLSTNLSTKLAQLITYNNSLPQGSCTSPIISNMICVCLDKALINFAKTNNLFYSRYADDITFSSQIATAKSMEYHLRTIQEIIEKNGFVINTKKTRIQTTHASQRVTGLIVNKKLNIPRKFIREVRSNLHNLYYNKTQSIEQKELKSIKGQIAYIQQVRIDIPAYLTKLQYQHNIVQDQIARFADYTENIESICKIQEMPLLGNIILGKVWNTILIHCEGASDIIYFKAAFQYFKMQGLYSDIKCRFVEHNGNTNLIRYFKVYHGKGCPLSLDLKFPSNPGKHAFILDGDGKSHYKQSPFIQYKSFIPIECNSSEITNCIEGLLNNNIVKEIINIHGVSNTKLSTSNLTIDKESGNIRFQNKSITKMNLAYEYIRFTNDDKFSKFIDILDILQEQYYSEPC